MDVDGLLQRVALLERRQRRQQTVAVVALVSLAGVALMGQTAPPPIVTAQEFVLVDKAGVVKARIGSNIFSPGIEFRDPEGHPMMAVQGGSDMTLLSVSPAPDPNTGLTHGRVGILASGKLSRVQVRGKDSDVSLFATPNTSWIRVGQQEADPDSPL